MSVVALCGGVGGAKLALGLSRALPPQALTVIVNTGDDFDHLGLRICPDLDTVLYTLAGLADPDRGWGRRDETWNMMEALEGLGGATWFRLGDRDLALHLVRTQRLRSGDTLSVCMDAVRRQLGIRVRIVPSSDDRIETRVLTDVGELAFQEYFVARRCQPRVRRIGFAGADAARAAPAALEALTCPDLDAIVICPSNPFLSVDPILAVSELRRALIDRRAPCIAVSPLVGGAAVKGPTDKIMRELELATTPGTIGRHFAGLIDGLVIDRSDLPPSALIPAPVPVFATTTLMRTLEDREALARFVLDCAGRMARGTV